MADEIQTKVRVLKAPAVRRGELIDCAQRLFLSGGYERTTINDVIAATGLSKGAFYHHFRSKEALLEAITARFAEQALAAVESLQGGDALQRLNRLLAVGREWKLEHIAELRAMFATLLKPENAMLYQRIVDAVYAVMTPLVAGLIEQGRREGLFDVDDAGVVAETVLWLGNGRRPVVMAAMALAETDLEAAVTMIANRVRAEETIIDRILGLAPGGVNLIASEDELRDLMVAWRDAGRGGGEPVAR